jgi:hypothetical protein
MIYGNPSQQPSYGLLQMLQQGGGDAQLGMPMGVAPPPALPAASPLFQFGTRSPQNQGQGQQAQQDQTPTLWDRIKAMYGAGGSAGQSGGFDGGSTGFG